MEKCNEIKMEYGRLRQEIQNVLAGKLSDEELLRYFMATALKYGAATCCTHLRILNC